MDSDSTVNRNDIFSAGKTSLQTNGCEHVAFTVDCFVFSNSAYNDNDKTVTMTTGIANIYTALTVLLVRHRIKSLHQSPCL